MFPDTLYKEYYWEGHKQPSHFFPANFFRTVGDYMTCASHKSSLGGHSSLESLGILR